MEPEFILWDLDDDPNGNVWHCALHGVSKEDVEDVFSRVTDRDVSRTTGRPIVFGETRSGRHLLVVYQDVGQGTIYPITAYDVPRRSKP